MKTGLFPGPGGKGDFKKYPVWDQRYVYDGWVEPFVSAGHQVHRYLAHGLIKRAFVSDIDPKVKATWFCWRSPELREIVANRINGVSPRLLIDPVGLYEEMKAVVDSGTQSPIELSVASLICRYFVFGNTLRTNSKGALNVCASKDKTQSLQKKAGKTNDYPQLEPGFLEDLNQGWRFEWPWFGDDWNVSFSNSWQQCLDAFEASPCQNAIAFVDTPYWLPKGSRPGRRGTGALTPAYTHHGNPEGQGTLDLFINCIDRLLDNPRVGRVVATNYISDELCFEVARLLDKRKREWWFTPLGTLATMNNGSHRDDCPIEGFWEFGGRRMAGRYDQLSLLEAAA